jgi:hypothetical protein
MAAWSASFFFPGTSDERQFEEDEAVAVCAADEGRCVHELPFREYMRDAVIVRGRHAGHFLQRGLHSKANRSQFVRVKRTLMNVNLCNGHLQSLSMAVRVIENRMAPA